MADNIDIPRGAPFQERDAENYRRTLRDSANDLANLIQRISGAEVEIFQRKPEKSDADIPLLFGQYAVDAFGGPKVEAEFDQGWRLVVGNKGVGFIGQSGESASYAVYELLDRLGCRWFFPGELGEVLPSMKTITIDEIDVSSKPDTLNRRIWYGSADFKRRNRQGGFTIAAGHALDKYISDEKKQANPELAAERDGERNVTGHFLCWGNPETAKEVAATILGKLDAQYVPSVSLSPADGVAFCQCKKYCKPLDAGDWDPSMNTESITDRYIVFCNRIAEIVTKKYPDVRFGFLAYVQYTRPPVREKPHPSLVPEIAPITYCRAHTMDSDTCPSRPYIKPIVEGWTKVSASVAYYNYMFHLAEVAAPYPMMKQMAVEMPVLYAHGTPIFWQPETMANFETMLPGMWLTMRMAWDNDVEPYAVYDDLFERLYGPSAPAMKRYWTIIDDAWTQTPSHAGSLWSYPKRFTPEVLGKAREAMDEALAAAETPLDYRRIQMFDKSLQQLERMMNLHHDLMNKRLRGIDARAMAWMGTHIGLGQEYSDNSAFAAAGWSSVGNIAAGYFRSFRKRTYDDLGQIYANRKFVILSRSPGPIHEWNYKFIERKEESDAPEVSIEAGEKQNYHAADFDDSTWKKTDSGVDTWADMGLLGKYGTMWYRTTTKMPTMPEGKKIYLWIAATDGSAKVFVNGKHVPFTTKAGDEADVAKGYATPFSFDITDVVKPNEKNQITIAGTRLFINELGTGGLLGPIYIYREK